VATITDSPLVSARILTLPRLAALAITGLLLSATISLAADKPATTKPTSHTTKSQQTLVVPNVQGQLFVFGSGMLEDGGFGWSVRGSVGGYPANVIVSQSPQAGTRVIDTGAPTITLRLIPGRGAQLGQPQNRSPYGASVIRRLRHAKPS